MVMDLEISAQRLEKGTVKTCDPKVSAPGPFEKLEVLGWRAVFNAPLGRPLRLFPSIALWGGVCPATRVPLSAYDGDSDS